MADWRKSDKDQSYQFDQIFFADGYSTRVDVYRNRASGFSISLASYIFLYFPEKLIARRWSDSSKILSMVIREFDNQGRKCSRFNPKSRTIASARGNREKRSANRGHRTDLHDQVSSKNNPDWKREFRPPLFAAASFPDCWRWRFPNPEIVIELRSFLPIFGIVLANCFPRHTALPATTVRPRFHRTTNVQQREPLRFQGRFFAAKVGRAAADVERFSEFPNGTRFPESEAFEIALRTLVTTTFFPCHSYGFRQRRQTQRRFYIPAGSTNQVTGEAVSMFEKSPTIREG